MDDRRIAAYDQLIEKLLQSSPIEHPQILNAHSDLLDPGLLQRIIALAQYVNNNDDKNTSDFLTNLALQLGGWLGSAPQPTEIRRETADILFNWGEKQFNISQFVVAVHCWQQCLMIYQVIQDREGEAASLGNLGDTYHALGQYEKAIFFHKQHLAISREIKDRKGEANALGSLGVAYHCLGQVETAFTFYEQSLAIKREIKDRQGEANSIGNLGSAYHSLGQYEKAVTFQEQSLAIARKIQDRKGEAASLGNLGNAYDCLGQYEKAISFHEQCLGISREIKHRLGEANALGNLGNAYHSLGQVETAITFHEQHLAISRKIKSRQGEAISLGNLGNAYHSLGQFEKAIAFHEQYLAISRKIKSRQGEAISLGNLGNTYHSLGQFEKAIAFHGWSLAISQELKDCEGQASSLNNMGGTYRKLQQPDKAIEHYQDSLKIATPKTMPVECSIAGRNLGDIGFAQGDWELAIEGYEPALEAVEQLRKGSTTDERRQEIIAKAFYVYANAVQCYINLKQYDKAVEAAERSRARHLADLFASKDLYPQGEIPPEVEEYYRLQQQSSRLQSFNNDDMKGFAPSGQPAPNSEATLEKIKELEAEKQQAWLKIRRQDPVLAGQLQPDPLNFPQMQKLIDDGETAMLNFYTTREHTHIFILRQNQPPQVHTCEGEGLETLQNWIFENWLKLYVENPTVWQQQISEFLPQLAQRLQINHLIYQYLTGIKELIIIPHLSLHQIPFAALPLNNVPIPQSDITYDKIRGLFLDLNQLLNTSAKTPPPQPEYLSDKFRIRIVPSSQILNYCHQRGNLKPAKMGIVENATGDLVFTGYECERQPCTMSSQIIALNTSKPLLATIKLYSNKCKPSIPAIMPVLN